MFGRLMFVLGVLLATAAFAMRPGDTAPDFALLDADGNMVHLSDFRGTPVVLNAWATWCPFCVEEIPLFQTAQDSISADGEGVVTFLLVNLDEPFEVASRFLSEEVGSTLPALFDGTDEMRSRFGDELDRTRELLTRVYKVRGMPTTFFIDAEGVIQSVQIGPLLSTNQLAGQLKKIGVEWQP